jgi:hypothetical protein
MRNILKHCPLTRHKSSKSCALAKQVQWRVLVDIRAKAGNFDRNSQIPSIPANLPAGPGASACRRENY